MHKLTGEQAGKHRSRGWYQLMACGVGTLALASVSAMAQETQPVAEETAPVEAPAKTPTAQPENLLPSSLQPAPNDGGQVEQADQDTQSFDEAFPVMISNPVDQADLTPAGPALEAWTIEAAQSLIRFIEGIDAEGLDSLDYDLQALRVSVQSGPSVELDRLASKNFVWLVEDIRDGRTPMEARKQWFVVDPDRDRYRTRDLLTKATLSGDVAGVLNDLHPVHADYAALRDELAVTPPEDEARRKLIRANMDRWRWLPRDLGTIHLITNVPEFQLRLRAGAKTFDYKTIVGKPGRTATPQLSEDVSGVVFNPTWTVPQSIVKGEGLGERVLNDPVYAKKNGYKATKGANGWVTVVQQPGPGNSLGVMKLEMPNPHAIFFHDTPTRWMFTKDMRALSHGCIRTEKALEVAMLIAILGKAATKDEVVEISTSGKYTKVMLREDKKIPAYITYFTMGTNLEGELTTFRDIYDRDAPVLASLDQPRQENRATVSDDEVIVIENNPLAGG